jgi:hypothetical protein
VAATQSENSFLPQKVRPENGGAGGFSVPLHPAEVHILQRGIFNLTAGGGFLSVSILLSLQYG